VSGEIAIDSKITSIYLPLRTYQGLKSEAKRLKVSFNTLVLLILEEEIKKRKISLTPEDYEEIAKEIRKNKQRRIARRASP